MTLKYPVLAVTRDGSAIVFKSADQLTLGISKAGRSGQAYRGYLGMKIVEENGSLYEVEEATIGADRGHLYPGLNLNRLIFWRTRRVAIELRLHLVKEFSIDELRAYALNVLPSLFHSVVGVDEDVVKQTVLNATSGSEVMEALAVGA